MKRKGGLVGTIFSIFGLIIVLGFIIAILSKFDGDIVAALEWIWNGFMDLVYRVADIFTRDRTFQRITS